MAITVSTQGYTATPATDFRTTLANLLTGASAGWVEVQNTGVGTITSTGTAVAGSGSPAFTTHLVVGGTITASGQTRTISSITDATNLVVSVAFSPDVTAASYTYTLTSATDAGTTGNVRVFKNAAATTSGSLITGVIILIEQNDTTTAFAAGADATAPAIRIRCAEQYDTTALKVVYAAPGFNAFSGSPTPTGTDALSDAQQTIYQTPAAASTVGWIHLRTPNTGFKYWIGAEALRMIAVVDS